MNTQTKSELDAFLLLQTSIEVSHGIEDSQARVYCSVGVILMCLGVAEIDEQTIPQELSDMPIVALDNVGTNSLICTHNITPVFRVELGGQLGGIDQITKHHRELPSFR